MPSFLLSTPRRFPIPPTTVPPGSPLGRFLLDPAGTLTASVHGIRDVALAVLPRLLAVAFPVLALVVIATLALRRWRARRLERGSRMVTILVPPDVDPAGAELLWLTLHDLLRPPWPRRLAGQPHVTFELVWSASELRLTLWVPGPIPPGFVEAAVEAAWPGARTRTERPTPPLATDQTTVGGELRLAAAEWLPLRTEHPADPLRPLVGALAGLRPSESAAVQLLARPVTGRRLTRCRQAAISLHQ
ncbi:MAG TPA: type VI secretion protein, partial [Acidimicrobiia bacterium]|nr:type VI secretion protein [Acidimicrobiia bacterium]